MTMKTYNEMKGTSRILCMVFAAMLLHMSAGLVQAQTKAGKAEGGITPEMLSDMSADFENSPSDKAVRNALAGTSISVLAVNSENAAMIDTHFSDKVDVKGITDQKSSGRCWLFTGLNVLRAKMISKYDLGAFEFSENYLFFYDQLEKANLFLQGVIDTKELPFDDRKVDWLFSHPIGDGGQFTGVSNLIIKYGVIPADAMPETYCSDNTSQMNTILKRKLREDGLELRKIYDDACAGAASVSGRKNRGAMLSAAENEMYSAKKAMLSDIYRVLALCLGVPPSEFEWTRYNSAGEFVSRETYTPQGFYNEFIGEDLENNYVMIMNDPCREYGKVYEIDYDRHVYDGHNWLYVNLPVDRIKEIAAASIMDGTALYFSCDVGKYFSRSKGTLDLRNFDYESLFGISFGMDKKERVSTHDSGSSHAMSLVAVDIDPESGDTLKWMVENSWGPDAGYKGFLIMTDEWFDEYMFRLVAEKKYVPEDILKMMEQEPVLLPAWDPMFSPEI